MSYLGKKGFTLVEILIVMVILAVIASLATPIYASQIGKSRAQEGIQNLGAIRRAMGDFYSANGTYAGAKLVSSGTGSIGFDPTEVAAGNGRSFDYAFTADPTATAFTVKATCRASQAGGAASKTFCEGSTLSINEKGELTRTGVFV